nr:hypothetical protein [Tanacetum cinerariifolium]
MSTYWRELLGIHGPLVREIILEFFIMLRISSSGYFLRADPSYTLIREPLRRLCHRPIILLSLAGVREEARSLNVRCSLHCMARLRIYERLMDVMSWVMLGPKRQHVGATGTTGRCSRPKDYSTKVVES